jgi:type II secretory pathway pseudopilin PulG
VQHSIILRAAWALSVFLVLAAAAFAWAANQRERQYEQLIAQAAADAERATAARAAAGGTDAGSGAAADPAAATAAYEKRCARCHEPEEVPGWVAQQPAEGREAALFTFLAEHGKAPEPENRLLAAYFTAGGAAPP